MKRKSDAILALDLCKNTGWAISTGGSGSREFLWGKESLNGEKWIEFREWLEAMIRKHCVRSICYEAASHLPGPGARIYNGMLTVLEIVCVERKVGLRGVHLSTLKKHATGSGRADKEAMLKAARKRGLKKDIQDHDRVDALWVLDWALKN